MPVGVKDPYRRGNGQGLAKRAHLTIALAFFDILRHLPDGDIGQSHDTPCPCGYLGHSAASRSNQSRFAADYGHDRNAAPPRDADTSHDVAVLIPHFRRELGRFVNGRKRHFAGRDHHRGRFGKQLRRSVTTTRDKSYCDQRGQPA